MNRAVWRLLGKYVPHCGRRFLVLGVLSACSGVFEAGVLVFTVRAAVAITNGAHHVELDVPGLGHRSFALATLLWCSAGLSVLSALVALVVGAMTARVSSDVLEGTRAATLRSFSQATWNFQALKREGSVQETVSNNAMQVSDLTIALARGLTNLVSLIALLAGALFVSAAVTGAVVVLGLLIVLMLRPVTRTTRVRAGRFVAGNARFSEAVAETSALALEMRVFGVEKEATNRLTDESASAARQAFLTRFSSNASAALYRNATLLFLVAAVAGLYMLGNVDIAAVGAVVVLMVRALSYAQQAQAFAQRINELSPNLVALDATIGEFQAAKEHFGSTRVDHVGRITLCDVSYSYGDQPALRDVNFEIQAGELLGVVGPSGGGKSTLVQVLLRLRLPTTGTVLVDGIPYADIAPNDWARLVSVVPQEPKLFAGTVAENIAFHRTSISRDEIVAAAERAHIAREIERLPDGYDTELSARGGGLSGGQRQRLAIARALIGEPDLLVLDEPTSALDVHSERLLQQTVDELEGRVTMVIIAHRLSTIAACRRLLVLDQGAIGALGPRAEVASHPFLRRAAG